MAKTQSSDKSPKSKRPPANSPEQQEQRLVALAMKRAEEMMESDNPPVSVVAHFLKLGSSREKAEQEKLARENKLLHAKVENLETGKEIKAIYEEALAAMRSYSGDDEQDAI